MAKTDTMLYLMVIAIVAIAAVLANQTGLIGKPASVLSTGTGYTVTGGTVTSCDLSTPVANTYSAYDRDQQATAVATPTYFVVKDDGTISTNSASYIPDTKLTVLTTKTNYYGNEVKFTTVCGGNTVTQYMAAVGTLGTINAINDDTVTANSATAAQAIGLGGSASVKVNPYETTGYAYFSNPDLNYFVVGYKTANVSAFDVSRVSLSYNGAALPEYSTASTLLGSNSYVKAWKVPTSIRENRKDVYLYLNLYANTAANPGADANVTLGFFDADYFVNSITQKISDDIENNAGTSVGIVSDLTKVIYTS